MGEPNINELKKIKKEIKATKNRFMKNNQRTREGSYGYAHPIEPISGYQNKKTKETSVKNYSHRHKPNLKTLLALIFLLMASILLFFVFNHFS